MNPSIIKAALFTPGLKGRWGLPLLFEGKPGTGKTSIVEQIAGECGLHCEVVIASIREPADFLGLPIPEMEGVNGHRTVRTVYAPPSWAERAAKAGRALVFLDELNTAPPAVQAALLRVVLEGQVGDLKLPSGVRFMAAQNATEDAAGGWDLAPPMANRFGHASLEVEYTVWLDWMLGAGASAGRQDPAAHESVVESGWQKAYAQAKAAVTSFLRSRPELLIKMPGSRDPGASRAWPSPRAWEMACRALASGAIHKLSESDSDEFFSSFVGAAVALEFCTFNRDLDLPDPEAVLTGAVKWSPDKKRLDRTVAVLSSIAAFVSAEKDVEKLKSWNEPAWGVLSKVSESDIDLVIPAARTLFQLGLRGSKEIREKTCVKIFDVLPKGV